MSVLSSSEWDIFLDNHPNAHILQSRIWGEFKANYGWKPVFIQSGTSGAQILFRRLPFGFSIGYIPKGPIGLFRKELLDEIISQCQIQKAIVLYVEPDSWEEEFDSQCLINSKFEASNLSIQPRRTILISLEGNENDWLEKMKQKTRYNIRLAQKKEICIEPSSDIKAFNHLMNVTGERNQFGIHDAKYYRSAYQLFSNNQSCELLIAKYNERPIAALMIFFRGKRAWYFYGASSEEERSRMPTYLLQWEAMKLAAKRGCSEYDLWGVPDLDETYLEKNFMSRDDGLWGVYRFKRGFGGKLVKSAGVFQKIINPPLFQL
ncbi:MAG: peptidoglycan bridge formation glycyltransferase FemA/FemB family protein, partial [Anaerolineaceae bacterium]|nr:peptidoglycan bridge formation glycyltransferase FemA/FemB family protein [Anaerolineaceae bacterium]